MVANRYSLNFRNFLANYASDDETELTFAINLQSAPSTLQKVYGMHIGTTIWYFCFRQKSGCCFTPHLTFIGCFKSIARVGVHPIFWMLFFSVIQWNAVLDSAMWHTSIIGFQLHNMVPIESYTPMKIIDYAWFLASIDDTPSILNRWLWCSTVLPSKVLPVFKKNDCVVSCYWISKEYLTKLLLLFNFSLCHKYSLALFTVTKDMNVLYLVRS